ncbi:MAG: ABC transporter ATP-binding protein [Clostridiales bacterium]|nr:ABC transporter ATP-binding protein [Clostridiales bacterium]
MDIRLINLTKRFGDKTVLDNVNISFAEGRISCLMGPSGRGKTTVANLIMGLIKPDSGTIEGCRGKAIAAVFQEDRLIEHWDAEKNIRLVCDKSVDSEQIREELQKVGINDYKSKAVGSFSGGMCRRVALVRALMARSDIVILDEPFKGLDDAVKMQVIEYLKTKTRGKTVIVITHDRTDAALLNADLITLE